MRMHTQGRAFVLSLQRRVSRTAFARVRALEDAGSDPIYTQVQPAH